MITANRILCLAAFLTRNRTHSERMTEPEPNLFALSVAPIFYLSRAAEAHQGRVPVTSLTLLFHFAINPHYPPRLCHHHTHYLLTTYHRFP